MTEMLATDFNLVSMDAIQNIQAKIMHVLSIYPKLSPSMLQVGVGPGLTPDIWKPMLANLIERGLVQEETVSKATPTGRKQQYTVISLSGSGKSLLDVTSAAAIAADEDEVTLDSPTGTVSVSVRSSVPNIAPAGVATQLS